MKRVREAVFKMKFKRITEQVRRARLEKGWTQQKLAEETGMMQSAIARLEAGHQMCALTTLIRVVIALDKRIEIL